MARLHKNGEDKQAEIFAAAVRIFQKKGYHAASMQDLADAVGLQKASLYYYVSSKEDLLTLSPNEIAAIFSDLVLNGVKDAPRRKARKGLFSRKTLKPMEE